MGQPELVKDCFILLYYYNVWNIIAQHRLLYFEQVQCT